MKRYSLVVTDNLWSELESVAEKEGENVVVIIRRFIKLGLLLSKQDSRIILYSQDGTEQEIVLI